MEHYFKSITNRNLQASLIYLLPEMSMPYHEVNVTLKPYISKKYINFEIICNRKKRTRKHKTSKMYSIDEIDKLLFN